MDQRRPPEERAKEVMASVSLLSATMRLENDGGVEKALDVAATGAGISRAAYVATLDATIPILLTQAILDEDFRNRFAAAAGVFLKNPKSLSVIANPLNGLPLAEFALKLYSLPQVLNLEVEANR